MIIFGWLAAIVVGVSQPVLMIVFGQAVDDFTTAGKFSFCDENSTTFDTGLCALTLEYLSESEQEMLDNINNGGDDS